MALVGTALDLVDRPAKVLRLVLVDQHVRDAGVRWAYLVKWALLGEQAIILSSRVSMCWR